MRIVILGAGTWGTALARMLCVAGHDVTLWSALPEEAVRQVGMVVEGIHALAAARTLADRYQVEMPIVEEVDRIIHHGISAQEAVATLMGRALKSEIPANR
ncbi:MAG: hypothetical protein IJR36_07130 [Lachnospiraceae bacterium]|nr:hypothetical protein [Lachnospiraceae bacterium]